MELCGREEEDKSGFDTQPIKICGVFLRATVLKKEPHVCLKWMFGVDFMSSAELQLPKILQKPMTTQTYVI